MVSGGLVGGLEEREEAAKADKVPTSVSISKEGSGEVVCSWTMKEGPTLSSSGCREGGGS